MHVCNYNHWGICEIQTQTPASVSFPSALHFSSHQDRTADGNFDIRRWSVILKETEMQLFQAHQTKLSWNNDGELTNTGPEHHADVMHFWLVFQLSPVPLVSCSAVNVVVVMSMCTRVIIPFCWLHGFRFFFCFFFWTMTKVKSTELLCCFVQRWCWTGGLSWVELLD